MEDVFFDAFNEVTSELGHISALIAGVCCLREQRSDMRVEIALLSIAEKKVAITKLIVKAMLSEHVQLEEKKEKRK